MNEFRVRDTGAVISEFDLRVLAGSVSLPNVIDKATCDRFGIDPVLASPAPTITRFQTASRTGTVQDALGNWVWDWTVTNWPQVQIDQQISDDKKSQWNLIVTKRDNLRLEGGVKVGTNWFKSTDRAVTEYNSLINIATASSLPGTTVMRSGWRTMVEGVTVDMTPDLAKQILAAGLTQLAAIDDAAEAHRTAMEASTDPAAYDFSTGWPETFLDLQP